MGLGGWALMLLAGVSYHVVPMFQLTRPYPAWFTRGFGPLLLLLLLAWSGQYVLGDSRWPVATGALLLAVCFAYGAMTLWLQYTTPPQDPRCDVPLLPGGDAVAGGLRRFRRRLLSDPGNRYRPAHGGVAGVLAIVGVFVSAITGMMYKITPFLNWLHLQRLGAPCRPCPT